MALEEQGLRPRVIAFAVALALGLSGCGGGGGSNVKPSANGSGFTGGSVNVAANNTLVWPQDFTGSINLVKDGAGTLILSGTNTYSGGTLINAGTLQIGNGGNTGSLSGNVTDNGVLAFNRADDIAFTGDISGSGSVRKDGSGTLFLTGNNTYAGGTTIQNGTLQIGDGGTSGSIVGNVTNDGALIFDRQGDVSLGGNISGSGSLENTGLGKLILTGSNTYSGDTTISAGSLQIGDGGTSGSIVGNVAVNAYNGDLIFNRSDDWTYAGSITGSGGVEQLGKGTLSLSGVSTYTGPTLVSAGTMRLVAGGSLGQTTISVGGSGQGGTFEIDSGAILSSNVTLLDGGVFDNAGTVKTGPAGSSAVQGYDSTSAVAVKNRDGAVIEGNSSQPGTYIPAISLPSGSAHVENGMGSTIRGYAGIQTGGTVNNHGGSVIGLVSDGISDASVVNNTSAGSIVAGTGGGIYSITAIGVKTNAHDAAVSNVDGSTITGVLYGVRFGDGGTVSNDNNSSISGSVGLEILSASSATGTVANTHGSTISGKNAGIVLTTGGTVTNGAGSIIKATDPASGDCSVTLACAIYVPAYMPTQSYGSDGSLTLTNAGTIVGDVQMDPNAVNNITLVAGGAIQGDLRAGSNAQSTLTLGGATGTTQSYSGAVSGVTVFAGQLVKDGEGIWIVDNAGLQSVVDTSIKAGSLQATHALAGNVGVVGAGNLDGVPGVLGNLSNAGRVSVHGGDTTVGGNYVGASTSTLAVSLGSRLAVTGTAALNGGTLEVTGTDAGYVSSTHTDVLTATGGVTGTFSQLLKDSGVVFTSTTIQYDGTHVWLDTTGLNVTTAAVGGGVSYTPASFGSAQRVQGAFNQLNRSIASGDIASVSSGFLRAAGQFQQAPNVLAAQASLKSLSGELYAAGAAMTFQAINESSQALSNRFDEIYAKNAGFGVWTRDTSIGGHMARAGFDSVGFQLNGWLVGRDRPIGQSGMAGFAFGESGGSQRMNQGFDHDSQRSTVGMLYAGWFGGDAYAHGVLGFGHFKQDVNRQLLLGYSNQGVSAQFGGNYTVANGESGLHLDYGDSRVTPFVSVEYAAIHRGGFAEQGAGGFGLRSNMHTVDRWQAGVGVRAVHHWNLASGRAVDISARAQWRRTLMSHGDVFGASFVGLEQWQPLVGIGLSRYHGSFGVGLSATLSEHTSLKFGYDYDLGQHDRASRLLARLTVAL